MHRLFNMLAIVLFLALAAPMAMAVHAAERAAAVSSVEHSKVCMVQNRTGVGMKMIPVEVEGKTYYGCCQGCVGKLKFVRGSRYAKDPVSGAEVDKANAFIVAENDGTVTYYESRQTAERHRLKRAVQ